MKFNKWTLALAAAGVVSIGSVVQAEEAQQHPVMSAISSTTLSGYVDTSAIWRPGSAQGGGAGAFTQGNKHDGFNLNVVKVTLEKPLDDAQWSAGYRVDLLFGPDAQGYNPSVGNFGVAPMNSDVGVKQAYVNLRVPVGTGLDFKLGTFDTVIGYEVFESPNNPNYSRSYGWGLEPTQHTGLLASYRATDFLGFSAGIANTYNAGINARAIRAGVPASETEKTYMASITLTAPDSLGFLAGSALYAGVVDGLAGGPSDVTSYYAGVTMKTPMENLSVGASYDYRGTKHVGAIASTYANAVGVYASLQAGEKLKLNLRGEYASASTDSVGVLNTGVNLGNNEVMAATATVDYSLWANVISRLEARWDHDLSQRGNGSLFGGPGGPLKNLFTVALNVIYKF